jgi:hypothetical protein
MKKINIGTFYGWSLFVEVEEGLADIDWNQKWREHIDYIEKRAVEEYKSKHTKGLISRVLSWLK